MAYNKKIMLNKFIVVCLPKPRKQITHSPGAWAFCVEV